MTYQKTTLNYTIWHPFTCSTDLPLKVVSGQGAKLKLENRQEIYDLISSWWVNLHGHAHPRIAKAIYEQALKLEQVIFAGFTHEPAEKFVNHLLKHLPETLKWCFFSDNGSTSVEVALKMAVQYWQNCGVSSRQRFIGFEGGYHGDTAGAMSAGGSSPFWKNYHPLMFDIDVLPYPATFENDPDAEAKECAAIEKLHQLISCANEHYAGIIIEPLIQGAGGMRMCRPQFLKQLENEARSYNLLIIYDEVMTGFGRTGDWFACNKSATIPDIICLSKGISGGFMPLALTICTNKIHDTFISNDVNKLFFHGHSYTANPLACAAALTSLNMLEENPHCFTQMEQMHRHLANSYLQDHPAIKAIRFCGTIMAFDITGHNQGYFSEIGPGLRARFLKEGYLIRPLGNTVYLMPPYCISQKELLGAYQTIRTVLDELI